MRLLPSLALASMLAATLPAQDSMPAREPVPNYSLQANSFIEALLQIASAFQLPLAVEWVKSPEALNPVHITRQNTNAAEMLDAVIAGQGDYIWEFENGIVHVFQKAMVNDPRNPLNVRISEVPTRAWTIKDIDDLVFDTAQDVVRGTGRKGLPGNLPGYDEPTFGISAQSDSVRGILNKVVTASKMKVWIATFPNDLPLTIKGFWEVTSMYDPKYVKAEDQPFWIFLRWGDAPWKRLQVCDPPGHTEAGNDAIRNGCP